MFFDIIILIAALLVGFVSTGGSKTQTVRLLDVFVYGPVLIVAATFVENLLLRYLLIIFGATTISYNLKNYMLQKA